MITLPQISKRVHTFVLCSTTFSTIAGWFLLYCLGRYRFDKLDLYSFNESERLAVWRWQLFNLASETISYALVTHQASDGSSELTILGTQNTVLDGLRDLVVRLLDEIITANWKIFGRSVAILLPCRQWVGSKMITLLMLKWQNLSYPSRNIYDT